MAEASFIRGARHGEPGRLWTILAVVVAVVVILELFRRLVPVDPGVVASVVAVALLATVLFVASRGGVRIGLVAAVLAVAYAAYVYSTPGRLFQYRSGAEAWRIATVGIALPIVALVVGILRERVDRYLARERAARDLVESILESVTDAFVALDWTWRFTYVNPRAEEICGRSRDELVGQVIWDVFPELEGTRFEDALRRARAESATVDFESYLRPFDRWLETHIYPSRQGLSIYFRDVSERKRQQHELEATASELESLAKKLQLQTEEAESARAQVAEAGEWSAFLAEAGRLMASSLDFEEILKTLTDLAVPTLADWSNVDVVAEDGSIRRLAVSIADPSTRELTEAITRRYPPDPSAAIGVARVLRTGEPELLSEITDETLRGVAQDEEHLRMLRDLGMRSAMIVPLVARGRIIGSFTLISGPSGRRYGRADLERAMDLAARAALAADNARLYRETVRSESRSQLLAEASRALVSTLDYRETLNDLVRLVVPAMADFCTIDIAENGRGLRRAAVAHSDPSKEPILHEFSRYPPGPDNPLVRVLETGEPELHGEFSDAWLDSIEDDPRHREVMRRLGGKSVMIVPLHARGHTLGVMTFGTSDSSRRYSKEDLELAEEIGRRAAVAVDNARLFEQALAANQAKSDFLAVISHELRTPLNAIMGFTDLLAAGIPDPLTDAQAKQVARIDASARHLLELIDEILTFTRTETGREEVQYQKADLVQLIRSVTNSFEPLAREKGLAFHVDIPDRPTPIETDTRMVKQIIGHLLSNAVKFTERGEIAVSAEVDSGQLVIRVRDTGIGLAPEDLERIFDPFVQIERALTREKGGTGLGLSVTRRLARLLGGDVTVESELGEGSTFTVTLPLRREAGRDRAP